MEIHTLLAPIREQHAQFVPKAWHRMSATISFGRHDPNKAVQETMTLTGRGTARAADAG